MKSHLYLFILITMLYGCASTNELKQFGKHYKKHKDYYSLKMAVDLMPLAIETNQVKKILGKPIDNGFDYRFLTDSTSPYGCRIGAVFNINLKGKITHRWVDEICE